MNPDRNKLKQRYLSVRNEGFEVYSEQLDKDKSIAALKAEIEGRIRTIQEAMPLGKWTGSIEEEWTKTGYRIVDEVRP